eukprot:COSAG04_NODE_12896_length_630_cov_0.587571_1_plen_76_part_01
MYCDVQTCSGHGSCSETGECTCDRHFTGGTCDRCESHQFGSSCETFCSPVAYEQVFFTSFEEPAIVDVSPVPYYFD